MTDGDALPLPLLLPVRVAEAVCVTELVEEAVSDSELVEDAVSEPELL